MDLVVSETNMEKTSTIILHLDPTGIYGPPKIKKRSDSKTWLWFIILINWMYIIMFRYFSFFSSLKCRTTPTTFQLGKQTHFLYFYFVPKISLPFVRGQLKSHLIIMQLLLPIFRFTLSIILLLCVITNKVMTIYIICFHS